MPDAPAALLTGALRKTVADALQQAAPPSAVAAYEGGAPLFDEHLARTAEALLHAHSMPVAARLTARGLGDGAEWLAHVANPLRAEDHEDAPRRLDFAEAGQGAGAAGTLLPMPLHDMELELE